MEETFDVVVIGAGSGGLTTAVGLSKVGKKVLLIEREHMGGECTNSGCIPSKALLHHAKDYHLAKVIAGDNEQNETYRQNALSYVRKKIAEVLDHESPKHFEKMGIKVVLGEAEFISKCAVRVNETTYRYKNAVIATGSKPRLIDIDGLEEQSILTNQNIFTLEEIPKRLLVVGSGPIGMEMGQAFAMLGSQVTIATIDSRFAKLEDEAITPIIEKKFVDLGINILKNASIQKVENGQAIFEIKEDDQAAKEERVAFDKVLIAVGRVPNLPAGMEAAGIKYDTRCVLVDGQYRTSNKYVYAVGDVAQKLKFTHTASDVGRQVVKRIASRGWLRINSKKAVPKVTYTEPEIAQVGLSYDAAVKKYSPAEVMRIEVPYGENDRAVTDSKTDGVLVVIARRVNGAVLGANIIGERAGELISLFTLAIDKKVSMWALQRLIYAYPTYSLLAQKAGDKFLAEQLSTLKKDLGFLLKKHLPKIIALIFWSALIYSFQHYRISNGLSYSDMLFSLYSFFTMSVWGPLIYIVLYTIRPLILFPATLLTALSGALFGLWWGIIYTIVGENFSANLAYWIGRFFGSGLKLEDTFLGNWIEWLRNRPFESVLFMRLFYVPFDLANYGSGVLKVSWPSYATATLIGIMPGLTTFVALGAAVSIEELKMDGLSFDAFDPKFLALSITIFVVSLILSRYLKRWKAAK